MGGAAEGVVDRTSAQHAEARAVAERGELDEEPLELVDEQALLRLPRAVGNGGHAILLDRALDANPKRGRELFVGEELDDVMDHEQLDGADAIEPTAAIGLRERPHATAELVEVDRHAEPSRSVRR